MVPLGGEHTHEVSFVPPGVAEVAGGRDLSLVWANELGGLTFRIHSRSPNTTDEFIKWNPLATGVDLTLERVRLEWLQDRHPVPIVVSFGSDDEAQWLVTEALPGGYAVGDVWRSRRPEAIAAIAAGLRRLHSVLHDDFPPAWTREVWVGRTPTSLGLRPPVDDPVLVHGDACAPNTLIDADGVWTGNVDFGDLAVGDRWADLAIASLSLDWNFGEGHQEEFFDAYGIAPDHDRIAYYRALWHLEA